MFSKWLKMINPVPIATESAAADPVTLPATAPCTPSSGHERHSAMRNFITRADSTSSDTTLLMQTAAAPPKIAPFRKKAITSIERTRKLSILLKHQRTLVSFSHKKLTLIRNLAESGLLQGILKLKSSLFGSRSQPTAEYLAIGVKWQRKHSPEHQKITRKWPKKDKGSS